MEWAEIISLAAFLLALVLAVRQIQMMSQEMRPYLSFSQLEPVLTVCPETGSTDVDFNLKLENVGKCVLRYETTQFDVFINHMRLPNVHTKSTGSVIGVNTTSSYNRFYTGVWQYPTNPAPQKYIAPNCKIIFQLSITGLATQRRNINYFTKYS